MDRVSWDEYFMEIAHLVQKRSTCLSRGVGAVIVSDNNIISTGYNGAAKGVNHCDSKTGCPRRNKRDYESGKYLELCVASHAEQNAIALAAKHGIATNNTTIYVTTFPCKDCMNSIINAGIKKVVFASEYNSDLSKKIALEADIELVALNK